MTPNLTFLSGGGEMGELIRSKDWSNAPLGPADRWPQSLKTVVRVMLDSRYAMWLGWGPDLTFLYNDAYAKMTLGQKHPWALGRPAREVWTEIWVDIGPRAEAVVRTGQATWDEGLLLFLERLGFTEETYHTFSYSPLPADGDGVGGMLCVVTEDTARIIGERRLRTLRELAVRTSDETMSVMAACENATRILSENPRDVPFALLYLLGAEGRTASLASVAGIESGTRASPSAVELESAVDPWLFRAVIETGAVVVIDDLPKKFGPLPGGAWPEPPQQAVVLPVTKPGHTLLAGFVVIGISARRPLDDGYRGFLDLVAGQIATAVANARAYEAERKRAEALAELDRAKTVFFSNVSHELRTPLTLMLGPLEDLKAEISRSTSSLDGSQYQQVDLVHRNGLRLLKLVNTLLDFSRIEAGRIQASYQPTDLAAVTADLASNFRSACEKAGLRFVVDFPPLSEPIYVDHDMWEKIVLNLLSNAFKFTFEGEIEVSLKEKKSLSRLSRDKTDRTDQTDARSVTLRVRDTGVGIPVEELPHMFERFHRIEQHRGRTHEGTGIGLALVQELVKLHGGAVRVDSNVGEGSTFTVTIPFGTAHLDQQRIGTASQLASTSIGSSMFVEEAARWLPATSETRGTSETGGTGDEAFGDAPLAQVAPVAPVSPTRPRVLLADDNADMREYVSRLLRGRFEVQAVPDGQAALDAARADPPDVVLTDVMMPRLDGFGLLRALRDDPETKTIPVILLSARAGEESRVEGLEQGADDYLIKPFSARELLARVEAHVKMARMRRENEERVSGILNSLTDGFQTVNADYRFSYFNPAARRTFVEQGMNPDELIGRHIFDEVFPAERDKPWAVALRRAMVERVPTDVETFYAPWQRWFAGRYYPAPDGGVSVFYQDITERKQVEDALRESEERFRNMADNSPVMMWVTDAGASCTYLNAHWYTFTGQTPETGLGLGWLDAVHPDDCKGAAQIFEAANAEQEPFRLEYRLRRFDGEYRWAIDAAAPRMGSGGEFLGYIGSVIDITDRKQAEDAVRLSKERFDIVKDEAQVGFWFCDLPFDTLIWDHRVKEHFWLSPNAPVTIETFYERLHPDDRTRTRRAIEDSIESKTRYDIEYRTVAPGSGEERWIRAIGRTFYDAQDRPIRFDGVTLDITHRKRAEEALRESEERYRTLFASSPMAVFVCDRNAVIQHYNARAVELWGRVPVCGVEQHCGSLKLWLPDGTLLPHAQSPMMEVLRTSVPASNVEVSIERPDGLRLPVLVNFCALRNADGEITGVITSFIDITERKRTEERLTQFTAELEQRVAERTYELAQSEDHLRTMATELNLAEQRERKRLATELHDHLQQTLVLGKLTIGQGKRVAAGVPAVEQMLKKVDDIFSDALTYTRTLVSDLSPTVLRDHGLASALQWLGTYMQKYNQTVTVTVPDGEDLKLPEDQVILLFQSVRELLINSSKHAGTGEATVRMEQRDGLLRIDVHDEGAGFDLAAAAAAAAGTPGGGISSKFGLFSIRERMRALGGSFDIQSAPGQGTTATLVLPLAAKPPVESGQWTVGSEDRDKGSFPKNPALTTAHSPLSTHEKPRICVLLVDDHPMMRQGLRSIVTAYEHLEVVGEAGDGAEAVELAQRLNPDVVVMDINMPKMNGIEATQQIKANQPATVVIGLSVNQSADTERKMKAAGAFTYLTKESAADALCHAIEQAMSCKQHQAARSVD